MPHFHKKREEVYNVHLAICLNARGIDADPETILKGSKRSMPDVFFIYYGLRCIIEGKMSSVSDAKNQVAMDAQKRVETGLAHLAVGVIYPVKLHEVPIIELAKELNETQLEFFIFTENGPGPWHTGNIDNIISELRLAHETVINDDVVDRAVKKLTEGIDEFSQYLFRSSSTCERLGKVLGIGETEND